MKKLSRRERFQKIGGQIFGLCFLTIFIWVTISESRGFIGLVFISSFWTNALIFTGFGDAFAHIGLFLVYLLCWAALVLMLIVALVAFWVILKVLYCEITGKEDE